VAEAALLMYADVEPEVGQLDSGLPNLEESPVEFDGDLHVHTQKTTRTDEEIAAAEPLYYAYSSLEG
jgi:hypothetical protein